MPVFLTTEEVAKTIRCTVFHVRRLIGSGELPASRTGKRRLLVSDSDLQKYLDDRKVQAPPEVSK